MIRPASDRGRLETPDKEAFQQWLQVKGCRCPSCSADDWGDPIGGYLPVEAGWYVTQQQDRPVILLPCQRCGYLSFFCPFITGIEKQAP